jgi:hypothetical protein
MYFFEKKFSRAEGCAEGCAELAVSNVALRLMIALLAN